MYALYIHSPCQYPFLPTNLHPLSSFVKLQCVYVYIAVEVQHESSLSPGLKKCRVH